jgi:hypothetical protein
VEGRAVSEEEDEIAGLASKFEAVKIAMTQDKNGHVLKLSIHPSDTPEDILRDPVGTRYLIVAVRIGDDEQPVASPTSRDGSMAVKMAGALCGDARFQSWLVQIELADVISEPAAAEAVRTHCGVGSRSDLKMNAAARRRFLALRDEFAHALRRGTVPKG